MSSFGGAHSVVLPEVEADWKAGRLADPIAPIPMDVTCALVHEKMKEPDAPSAVAVIDDLGRPLGLVNRLRFLARYSQRFIPELYDRRPILAMANTTPFVVEESMTLGDLANMITLDHPDALRDCFIVTQGGQYLGIGSSEALIKAKVALLTAREEQLRAALVAAEDADRTRSNFLALMSHELRTPLNAIIGFSEVLSGELFGPHLVPRYGEYASDILGAGRHLLALINDILDLSKSESGQLELFSEPVTVRTLVEDCLRLVHSRAVDGKVDIRIAISQDLPPIRADELRLKQVVLNLITNAVKFTMPGGKVEIDAHLDDEGGMMISISDTGIGMAPDMIHIALEPFRQISSPLSRNVEGTGLGLSLAKSLTERHGGVLLIDSEPGLGTTVTIKLPRGRTILPEPLPEVRSA
jgi:two-component system cell cycle sensor histidine kinase PleC